METSSRPVSPLRQRMLEDMHMRKLAPKTQDAYIRAVSRFGSSWGARPTPPLRRPAALSTALGG